METANYQFSALAKPMNKRELLEFLGFEEDQIGTIEHLTSEGMPRFYVGKEVRYDPVDVVSWLKLRSLARTQQSNEPAFDPKEAIYARSKRKG